MSTPENVHATGILLVGKGVLLRGASGSGKSLLALLLLDRAAMRGIEGVLVADDRVDLLAGPGGISMRAPAAIAGLIELRGRGILRRPYRDNVRLDLVVDLVPALERMPAAHDFTTQVLGQIVARCPVPQAGVIGTEHQQVLIEEALSAITIGG